MRPSCNGITKSSTTIYCCEFCKGFKDTKAPRTRGVKRLLSSGPPATVDTAGGQLSTNSSSSGHRWDQIANHTSPACGPLSESSSGKRELRDEDANRRALAVDPDFWGLMNSIQITSDNEYYPARQSKRNS